MQSGDLTMEKVNPRAIHFIKPLLEVFPNKSGIGGKYYSGRKFFANRVKNPGQDDCITPLPLSLQFLCVILFLAVSVNKAKFILSEKSDSHKSAPDIIVVNTNELVRHQNNPRRIRRMKIQRMIEINGGRH
ncbi:hypothetical protein V6Z12_A12G198200 [Gossypium hirsutum]